MVALFVLLIALSIFILILMAVWRLFYETLFLTEFGLWLFPR